MHLNPRLERVTPPPIVEVHRWLEGRRFPPDRPLIDLTQAAPDTPPSPDLVEYLAGRLADPQAARYTPVEGIPSLRAALARHHTSRYGVEISDEDVIVTSGANQAFWPAVLAVAGPGDEVIVPLPYYFNHVMTLEMLGIRPILVPFDETRSGVPDPDRLAALATPRTRALVLVTPNNPTGAAYPAEVLDRLAELALDRRFALILDETYLDFLPPDRIPHRLFSHPERDRFLIHLYSFSKALALPGYRIGALVAGQEVRRQALKVQDSVVICAPHPAQMAARYGLEHLDGWMEDQRERVSRRQEAFAAALVASGSGSRIVSAGTYFAYLRHPFPDLPAVRAARRLLDEIDLLSLPGTVFGPGQDPYLRLAVGNVPQDRLEEAAERLASVG